MKSFSIVATAGLALAASPGFSHAKISIDGDHCDIESRYSTRIEAGRIAFTDAKSKQVVTILPGGALEVDGKAVSLDAADQSRIVELDREMRALMPEVKALAVEAVGLAFEAVGHVSMAFAPSAQAARESAERIARTAEEIKRTINARDDWGPSSETEIEELVEGAVGSLIGEIVGNITAQAIAVAFSGDTTAVAELEARASSIEANVEKVVEKRAKVLEARAEELCRQVQAIDRIEAGITARLPDGSALNLVEVSH
ncbi:DUF2884 family protein [Dokdonella sp.]|uniref:DUF2884 family protein n=1 Tax=Dokdonella sp. TaxID=2291710 RepID=UPI003C693558